MCLRELTDTVLAVFSAAIDCNRSMPISKTVFSDLLYKAPLEGVQKLPLLKCAYSEAQRVRKESVPSLS